MERLIKCYKGRFKYLMVLVMLMSFAANTSAADFDPDKILQDKSLATEVQKIKSDTAAKQFFDTHSQAFGVSKTVLDFLQSMSGGEYVKQIEAIMSVPVQKWNMHKGLMGGYDIVKVKQIVGKNQTVPITSRLSEAAGHAANALAVISIMIDIRAGLNGDDQAKLKAIGGTVEAVKGYLIGKYGGAAMGTAMLGPAVIGIALTSFMTEAQAQYTDYWWQAYNSYLNTKYPKLVTGANSWADLSKKQGYEGVKRRLHEFWDDPYANAAEYYGKAGIQSAPDLAQRTLKDQFAAEYYRNYIHTTLKTYYVQQAEQARAAAYIRAMRAYNELKAVVSDASLLMAAIKDAEKFLEEDIEELTLTPTKAEIKSGETVAFKLIATLKAEGDELEKKEMDVTTVATWPDFMAGGSFTGKEQDRFDFVVKYADKEATGEVEVEGPKDLTIAPVDAKVKPYETITYTVTAVYEDETTEDVTNQVEWPAEAPGGVYKFEEPGTGGIHVEFAGLEAHTGFDVMDPTELTVTPAKVKMKTGETVTFVVTASYEDGSTEDVTDKMKWPPFFAGPSFTPDRVDNFDFGVKYFSAQAGITVEIVGPDRITVTPADVKMKVGDTVTFKVTAEWEDGTTKDISALVQWPDFAAGGVFTPKDPGHGDILIRYEGADGSAKFKVIGVDELTIAPADKTIKVGETVVYTVQAKFEDGTFEDVTARVEWPAHVGGPSYTPKEPGGQGFEVRWMEKYARARLTVLEPRELEITPSNVKVKTGEEVSFTASALFESDTSPDRIREDVTQITTFTGAPDGKFMSTDPGDFIVKAQYWKLQAVASVEVLGPKELLIEPTQVTLNIGDTETFVLVALYDDGSLEDVAKTASWAGADNGIFTAKESGEFTVAASYGGKNAFATVKVLGVKSVAISPSSHDMMVGEQVGFKANATFEDDHSEDVTARATWTGAPDGSFTATDPGSFLVTATFDKKSATANVTVNEEEEESTIDEVVDSLKTGEDEELCTEAEVRGAHGRLQMLVSSAKTMVSKFFMYAAKFEKEIADRAGEPCNNGVVAYSFTQAQRIAGQFDGLVDQAKDAGTQILTMKAFCPEAAANVEGSGGFNTDGVISALAEIGSDHSGVQAALAGMRARLGEYGCDENEVEEAGDQYAQDEMDPDIFQDGGTMGEIPGDGVDNDADGQQDENVEALAGYTITCVLFDSGALKDDIFNLSISGYGNLGTTPAGGLRSYGLDLSPGHYTATVTVILAPDDVGTYTLVILENGKEIASASDSPVQGAAVTVPFTVTGD